MVICYERTYQKSILISGKVLVIFLILGGIMLTEMSFFLQCDAGVGGGGAFVFIFTEGGESLKLNY